LTPTLKRIRWRLIWSSVLALIFCLGSFVLTQWVYAVSDDQCSRKTETGSSKVVIQEILPNGAAEEAGILEGDELLAIQGRKITSRNLDQAQLLINEQPEGRILIYTVRRGDRVLYLPIRLVKTFNWKSLFILLAGLVSWGIGLLVVVSSPQRKIARHFFYMGLLSLLLPLQIQGLTGGVPLVLQLPAIAISGLVLSVAPPLWFHFFLRFPHAFPLRTNRRFLSALYGGFLFVGLLSTFATVLVHISHSQVFAKDYGKSVGVLIGEVLRFLKVQAVGGFFDALIALAAFSGLALFWAGTLRLADRRRQALLPALFFTTAIFLDLGIYTYLSMQAEGQSAMFRSQSWIFFAPLPLLPLSFGYAIFRHGFFDVRRALLRWLTYFLVLGITLAAYLAGLAWAFGQGMQVIPSSWVGVLVGLSALPIGWLLRWLLMTLRRMFRRDLSTARDLILGSLRETRRRFSEEALLRGLATSLREAFRPQLLLLLPIQDGCVELPAIELPDFEDPQARALSRPLKLRIPALLLRHARENQELVLGLGSDESDWIREQGPAARAHVDALGAQVLVILLTSEEPHSAVILGGKYAELNYGRDDRELLREVAIAAGIILETALLHRRMLDQGRIEQELQTARRIQESLITSTPPAIPGYTMALRLEPALETGGDLLWVKHRPNGKWLAAVGDVSGKGLPAALYMSQATALLKFAAQQSSDLSEILPALDRTMRNLMGCRDFLTLCLLEWDENGTYSLARAGHPAPFRVKGPNPEDIQELMPQGRGLGLRPAGEGTWEICHGQLRSKEWIVLYSDGLTEAMGRHGELYGIQRFQKQIQHLWAMGSVRAACEAIYRDVDAFEIQNRDDRTLFILGRE
jgi:serine phosphatase RsbU (regulator of sigma subunit)